jgi:phosphoribosylformylglycinamidine synthase I
MKFGILVFPGTWSDRDCYYALADVLGQPTGYIWHKDTSVAGYDCLILPGGFAHGDYLRTGAIARFSPIMNAVQDFAARGGLVLGICNGFQILCEAGLLPGALLRNNHLQFRCAWTYLRVERAAAMSCASRSRTARGTTVPTRRLWPS